MTLSTNQTGPGLAGIGVQLCFEHHARDTWPWWADQAKEAGVRFVRQGEFVWDIVEPQEGKFDFSTLDEWVELLAQRGIATVLATPTAAPPHWLTQRYPQIVPTQLNGQRLTAGVRRHTCPTAPEYRQSCERLVRAMGRHYQARPEIIGWQIDNEFGHPYCYCPLCHGAFVEWLRGRFATIEEYNFAAGEFFLGRASRSFEEIPAMYDAGNSSVHHLYQLFMDHQIRDCWGAQARWLREEGMAVPVTTNAMVTWYGYDHEKLFADLDLVTGDAYPTSVSGYRDTRVPGLSFQAAYLRGIQHGRNFGIMETRCGPVLPLSDAQWPTPLELRYWALTFLAGGADFINFFRLDTCPTGMERGFYGLIPSSGVRPPLFASFQKLCAEVTALLPKLLPTRVPTAPVGIVYSHATHLDTQHCPETSELEGPYGNGYALHLARAFRALAAQNIATDLVYPGEDFTKYRVLILSALSIVDEALAAKIDAYVAGGGVVIMMPRTAMMDGSAKQWERPWPSNLTQVVGLHVEMSQQFPKERFNITVRGETELADLNLTAGLTVDAVRLAAGTSVLAKFTGHPAGDDLPAVTSHRYGQGTAYYVATFLEEEMLAGLLPLLLARHDIAAPVTWPQGMHYLRRVGEGFQLHFVFNSSDRSQTVALPEGWRHAADGSVPPSLDLTPLECGLFESKG